MGYRHILFDLDRTLWDFDGNAEKTFACMFDEFGIADICHTDLHSFHAIFHTINESLWEGYRNGTINKELLRVKRFSQTLEHFHAAPILIGRIASQMSDYYINRNTLRTGLMPGAKELLDYLSGKTEYTLSIITNGFHEAQIPKMRHSGLTPYFKHIFLSEEIGAQKPDVRFFSTVLQRLGAAPSECIVIGDDFKVDILGARNAAIPQIFYNLHPGNAAQLPFSPTYEVTHLLQIKDIL